MFWEGATFHGGGANATDERRYAVLVDFSAGYLRTQENFMASVGEARAATFPEDLQRLIGWAPSNSGLGLVYNHRPSPMLSKIVLEEDPIYRIHPALAAESEEQGGKQITDSPFATRSPPRL